MTATTQTTSFELARAHMITGLTQTYWLGYCLKQLRATVHLDHWCYRMNYIVATKYK